MDKINYFIEGLQGAGKTSLLRQLSASLSDYKAFHEGDFSPVELAWCAYVTEEQYQNVLSDYPSLHTDIKEKTVTEGEHKIICYTKILTDIPDFHRNLERFEIYNGNVDREPFENIILERFQRWDGEGQIFECSIFQNIIENQMLYFRMKEQEILNFYRKLEHTLADKPYRIVYLDVEDIPGTIQVIRKERADENGNELWFPLMIQYLEQSPYGREHNLTGWEGLLKHLEKRRTLEHQIINEIFKERSIVIKAKNYVLSDIISF